MRDYRIPAFRIKPKWALVALALPLAVTAFYLVFVPGSFETNTLDVHAKLDRLSAGIFFTGLGAGFVEEMVFRGMMMRLIEKKFGRTVSILVPSVLFGLLHLAGMEYDFFSCALVVLAGTMVGVMFSLIAVTGYGLVSLFAVFSRHPKNS